MALPLLPTLLSFALQSTVSHAAPSGHASVRSRTHLHAHTRTHKPRALQPFSFAHSSSYNTQCPHLTLRAATQEMHAHRRARTTHILHAHSCTNSSGVLASTRSCSQHWVLGTVGTEQLGGCTLLLLHLIKHERGASVD